MRNIQKILILWIIIGMMYFSLEGIWHIPSGGYANIVMLPIGGLCGVLVGAINQVPKFYNMKVVYQSLISTGIILIVELVCGILVNLVLGLHIWDYSDRPFNILGQICLHYGVLWFLISPFAIWLEDNIRYRLWNEGSPYTLLSIYRDLLTFK